MQELLLKDILKGNNQKYFNPVPFNSQSYQNQKEPRTSDQLVFKIRNQFTKISLNSYILSDQFDGVI